MRGVIKSTGSNLAVRSFDRPVVVAEPAVDPEKAELKRRLDGVAADLTAAQTQLALVEAGIPEREERAREAGFAAGLAQIQEDAAQRVATVISGVESASVAWNDRLSELDGLAAMLARRGLERIFGDGAHLPELVTRTIAYHVAELGQQAVVAIRVSADDFSDGDARDRLAAESGSTAEIIIDAALPSGDCRLDLRLGVMDVGVASQWRALAAFLDSLA